MRLAKPRLDIGLFTNHIAPQKAFWGGTVGLRFDHELTLREGWVQHRYDAHGSVMKVNHYVEPLAPLPATGYLEAVVASEGAAERALADPDGNRVRVVPPGTRGVTRLGIVVGTPDPARLMRFYCEAMEFERVAERVARCGDTLLFVEDGTGGSETETFIGPGWRYLTVQIFDADESCAAIVARGGRLAQAPVNFRDVARYGFVKDPDGNWIEISARTSLTGILPGAKPD
ncbi:MAG: VOC family protein [Gammaproteobacteria bacterium]|nr:VOC family protein [Gammaproteobacteria bacterium]